MTKQDEIRALNDVATRLTGLPEMLDKEYIEIRYSKKNGTLQKKYSKPFKMDKKLL